MTIPVAIRIQNKCKSFHSTFVRPLTELDFQRLKSSTGCIDIWHHNANVSKAPRIIVTVMIFKIRIIFCPPIVSEFNRSRLRESPFNSFRPVLLESHTCD